jgi:hypothetical protein
MKQKEQQQQQQHVPLRVQLILSLLSGKPIKLKNIRTDSDEPGLTGKIFRGNRKCFKNNSSLIFTFFSPQRLRSQFAQVIKLDYEWYAHGYKRDGHVALLCTRHAFGRKV